ncbi:MAG: glycoside hydrolase family 95 protein [Devosia sp.]|uniref:glycoside hydrolase family 95 protein n=1 Tax=Devosia sp. TaxID=1871048 RepID=UPI001A59BBC0|nr:glycoside hydrolase family 95 protein [Devosia sp.]MBL8598635.1 glycoside hydrolase family 95 protein [Devosia sp.]
MSDDLKMWYAKPATKWLAALPVGNGRLGGMVFGRVRKEWIQLNEDSLWTGRPASRINPLARDNLDEMRRLIMAGDIREAQFLGENTMFGTPPDLTTYETLSNLVLLFNGQYDEEAQDYRRELDLETGIASVDYRLGNVTHRREILASQPAGCIAIRLTSSQAGALTFSTSFWRRYQNNYAFTASADDTLTLSGRCGVHGVKYETIVRVVAEGGTTKASGDHVVVTGANAATIYITCATDFRHADYAAEAQRVAAAAVAKGYDAIRAAHIADHQSLFNRMSLKLALSKEQAALNALPTDERLARVKAGESDEGLVALTFAYGRYMLQGASRPGTLPTNLQGIWNDTIAPAWDSKYTININQQMHYWSAETTNLADTHLPLFDLIESMRESGREVARVHYGCRGFVAHHNTDIWGDCAPLDNVFCGLWPLGAAWLVLHLWEHYTFAPDLDFLRDKAYPAMKEAAEFLVDFAIEGPDGQLLIGPSISPENAWKGPSGERLALCMSSTMDVQITRALFDHCIEAAGLLGVDSDFAATLAGLREKLPPTRVDGSGRIAEWLEDVEEYEPGHRHNSHLFALYPDDQITPRGTPELAAAARKSLEFRIASGGAGFCWSCAWIVGLWARLGDGDKAHWHAYDFLRRSTEDNLFSMHPPQGSNLIYVFQADGNLGLTAALAETLLQSQAGQINLLPALPAAWPKGEVRGMRARGGFDVDLSWEDGRLVGGTLLSVSGQPADLVSAVPFAVTDAAGRRLASTPDGDLHRLQFATAADGQYAIARA